MKVKSLTIENFGPIKNATLYLADKGLVSIEGVNEDDTSAESNGSGKSTIVDALYWTIFGKSPRGDTKDNVIKDGEKYCLNKVVLQTSAERQLTIVRGRGSKKQLKVFLDVEEEGTKYIDHVEVTKGTEALTQEYINMHIGCSERIFLNSVYSQQDSMPNIPEMTDKEIKTLLEEVAGMEEYEEALKITREATKEIRKALETAQSKQEILDVEIQSTVGVLNWKKKELEHFIKSQKENKAKLRAIENEIEDISKTYDKENGFNKEYANSVIKSLKDDFGFETEEELKALADKIETDITALKAEIAERKAQREQVSAKITETYGDINKNQYRRENLLAEKKRIQREKEDHSRECHLCGSVLSEEKHAAFFETNAHQLEKNIEESKRLNKEANALLETYEALKARRDKLDLFVSKAQSKCESMKSDHVEHLQALQRLAEAYDTINNSEENKRKYTSEKAKKLGVELGEISNKIAETRTSMNRVILEVSNLEAERDSKTKQLLGYEIEAKAHGEQLLAAEAACEVLSQKGVRGTILDTVTPFLNAKTSEYLTALSDGRITAEWATMRTNAKGDAVENFSIEVSKEGGGKTFAALSGGEKRKVRIACALALQDYVATRANKPIDLFIGDEIDDALDTAGLERLMGILQKKAREKGTVLLISHNDLRDWITENTTVTMKPDKTSHISGSLTCP